MGIPAEKLALCRQRLTSEGLRLAARALYASVNLRANLGAPIDVHLEAVLAAWTESGAVSDDGVLGHPCAC